MIKQLTITNCLGDFLEHTFRLVLKATTSIYYYEATTLNAQ